MSWLAKLYETYDNIVDSKQDEENGGLWPISHFVKYSHIEVVIDFAGNFIKGRSKILHGIDSPTLIPATESSAGRSGSKIAPHPLCEELGYCASDNPSVNTEKVNAYMNQLKDWAYSDSSHPKVKSIYKYLLKKTLWRDLSNEFEFPLKVLKTDGTSQKISVEKVFVRWRVEEPGNPVDATWEDIGLIHAWISYDAECNSKEGFCCLIGEDCRIASNHPRFLRWPGDGAKLISSNDTSGFTFRGRFTDTQTSMGKYGAQPVCIGFEATQKAHNALRWLITRQGYRNGDQVYFAWAVSGKSIPAPLEDAWTLLGQSVTLSSEALDKLDPGIDHSIDSGESFAHEFNKYLAGYRSKFKVNDQIVIMGLDSATPGRMGIIYYRELLASEFLQRLESWHVQFAWPQRHMKEIPNEKVGKKVVNKTIWPLSSPAPRNIVEAAYGDIVKSNDTLKKNLLERILPCIVDGRPFPEDILRSAIRRASNRNCCDHLDWERNLGVVCALYRGFYHRHPDCNQRREHPVALEENNTSRDYLYGRLLAIAEKIEEVALSVGGENRPTSAARLMQRFADRPFSTWRNIEIGLQPYMQRLQSSRAGFLTNRKKELDAVSSSFQSGDFTNEKPLSGEFLLGYHCQRMSFRHTNSDETQKD